VLRDAAAVLFTSEEERLQARKSFWLYRANEQVVAYGTSTPPGNTEALRETFLAAHPQLRGKRLLLYLSRIHEKKGCDLLVRAFAGLSARYPELHLVMAGPDDTGIVPGLQAMAAAAGVADRMSWIGMAQGNMKWGAFHAAEAFVLPSHQENFGIAVAEALACGLPVLISDKINIWREIEADAAGIVAPDTLAGTSHLLAAWMDKLPAQRAQMAIAAQQCFQRRFTVERMAQSLLNVIDGVPA